MDFSENMKSMFMQDESTLATQTHAELFALRDTAPEDTQLQDTVAKYEHRAFAREWVGETGPLAAASLAVAIPAYTLGKATGVLESDAQTSSDYTGEMKHGFIGIGEGLRAFFVKDEPKQESIPDTKYPIVNEAVIKRHKLEQTIDKLLPSLIQTESSGSHTADDGELITSPKGAKGITQVLPKTAKNPGYGIKPLQDDSEEEYIRFGRDYLTKMVDVFDDVEQGVAAYNAGPGAIHRAISKAARTGKHWTEYIPQETRDYIKKVTSEQVQAPYGLRPDGSPKNVGYFGKLKVPNSSNIATEYSIGVEIDGKEIDIPSLVPTLTKEELADTLQRISKDEFPSEEVIRKAELHARKRIAEGKSPFFNDNDWD